MAQMSTQAERVVVPVDDAGNQMAVLDHGREPTQVAVAVDEAGLNPKSIDGMWRIARMVAVSGLAPATLNTPEKIVVALAFGAELGMRPMRSLRSIAVIRGFPCIYGDAALALVRASGKLQTIREYVEGDGETMVATCETLRVGDTSPRVTVFGVADARRAKLWAKDGPWSQYPARMLMFRARGFNLRDNFPDVLAGLITAEEAADYPEDHAEGATRVVVPQSVPGNKAAELAERLKKQTEARPAESVAQAIEERREEVFGNTAAKEPPPGEDISDAIDDEPPRGKRGKRASDMSGDDFLQSLKT